MNHESLSIPELVAVVAGLMLFAATTRRFADRFSLPFTLAPVLTLAGRKQERHA